MSPLIIYHKNCADGTAAAWAVKHHRPECTLMAWSYGDPVTEYDIEYFSGREVYIVDFSFKLPVMRKILESAERVHWMDHHAGAADELRPLLENAPSNFHYMYRTDKSGCVLAWEYMQTFKSTPQPVPLLLQHISDYDTWAFKMPNTKAVIAYIYAYGMDDWRHVDTMIDDLAERPDHVYESGKLILSARAQLVKAIVEDHTRNPLINLFGRKDYVFLDCPHSLCSDASETIMDLNNGINFVASYRDTKHGRSFSLRARKGHSVRYIAERYGGSGHDAACGFKVSRWNILAWI